MREKYKSMIQIGISILAIRYERRCRLQTKLKEQKPTGTTKEKKGNEQKYIVGQILLIQRP